MGSTETEEKYKNNNSMDHILAHDIPCPFCLKYHQIQEVDSNGEDVFYGYAKCPEFGEIRVTFEFQDHFKRQEII